MADARHDLSDLRDLLARHLPDRPVRSIVQLGRGSDNVVYDVDDDLIVRCRIEAADPQRSETIRAEATLLHTVARWSTLPVPEPVFVDVDAGALAYRKVPGVALSTYTVTDARRLGTALGEFLGALHDVPLDAVAGLVARDDYPLSAWLDDARRDYGQIRSHLPAELRSPIEDFLAHTPPTQPDVAVFCHNDLGAEHIMVDAATGAITGVIDWTDAALTDPMRDLALVFRDLGPPVLTPTLEAYSRDVGAEDQQRLAFYARCSVLEDIAYGLRTGVRAYAEAGIAHLRWTFA
ncbi:aminoglycoside phosphotransferase family protein [Haloactinopolyspora sp.]|uniref:phosphotransferase family protein n=1 Tax=Haloactinopolyspora sp. TaxID=1966353 RepID=UPI0026120382|nr:aminoglycoside phosphotransferase family protein [Haloactinopolyspora sp.]